MKNILLGWIPYPIHSVEFIITPTPECRLNCNRSLFTFYIRGNILFFPFFFFHFSFWCGILGYASCGILQNSSQRFYIQMSLDYGLTLSQDKFKNRFGGVLESRKVARQTPQFYKVLLPLHFAFPGQLLNSRSYEPTFVINIQYIQIQKYIQLQKVLFHSTPTSTSSTLMKCTAIFNSSPNIFKMSNPYDFGTEIRRNQQKNKSLFQRHAQLFVQA